MMNDKEIIEQFLEFLENSAECSGSQTIFKIIDEHTIDVMEPSDEMQQFFIWINRDKIAQA